MSTLENANVLIADDEPGVLGALAEYLERFGSRVTRRPDGIGALTTLIEEAVDLAIVDASMPRLSGLEVIRFLRFVCGRATLPVLLITGRTDPDVLEATKRVGAHAVLRKPFGLAEFRAVVEGLLEPPDALPEDLDAAYDLRAYDRGNIDPFARSTLQTLARAVDRQDPHGPYHSLRVAEVARVIALELGLDQRARSAIHTAGLLHDIGKLVFPSAVLSGEASVTDSVREIITGHPAAAANLLDQGPLETETKQAVRHHHERWDGGGYPSGLAGDAISPSARVLAVAEAYAAMTSRTPFHSERTPKEALKAVSEGSGQQFDPDAAQALRTVVERTNA